MENTKSDTGIIIQARVGSTRLKNKMIRPFYKNNSILDLLIKRFKKELPAQIPFIIATTVKPGDDAIEEIATKHQVPVFRGSEEDVLQRFIDAATYYGFQKIVRICADNPLMDIEGTLGLYDPDDNNDWEYIGFKVKNAQPSITTHLGFWGEWVTLSTLKKIKNLTTEKLYHEHVTNYIYTYPESFNIKWKLAPDIVFNRSDIRLTVDSQQDFELVAEIYAILQSLNLPLTIENIIHVIDDHPDFLKRMAEQIMSNKK
jgi:spore coat polysaccharide biosynthesis protein SpsF